MSSVATACTFRVGWFIGSFNDCDWVDLIELDWVWLLGFGFWVWGGGQERVG